MAGLELVGQIGSDTFLVRLGLVEVLDEDHVVLVKGSMVGNSVLGARWMKFSGGYLAPVTDPEAGAAAIQLVRDEIDAESLARQSGY